MVLTNFQWYVIAINIVAFLVYTIDFQIYIHGGDGIKPAVLCNLVTICGGAMGTLAAEVLWDRKINKQNAQSRIYTLVWLILQVAFFWSIWGPNHETVKAHALAFYNEHRILCIYYAVINLVTFVVFAIDKVKAMMDAWRIREVILLGLCLLGGGIGGILAMDICNHKVNSMHFMVGVPLLICAHLVLIICIAVGSI
ncbi:MAG: DUF1294 domain-containing protein [Coriobacteriales bacterium]|nr:DUF1294 domain-containing protein [Coriobacteriales bacterium]